MDELRAIIYRERTDLDAFLEEHQLWEDLYDEFFLDSFNLLEPDVYDTPDIVAILNDVYFGCIKVILDPHPEVSFRTRYLKTILPFNPEFSNESILVASMMYAVLSSSKHNKRKNITRFLKTTEKILSNSYIFKSAKNFVENSKQDYNYTLNISPISPGTLDYVYGPSLTEMWLNLIKSFVTPKGNYYNILSFRKILSLYATKEDKLKVLRQMEEVSALAHDPDETYPIITTIYAEVEKMLDAEEATPPTPLPTPPTPPLKQPAPPSKEGRVKDYLFNKSQAQALAQEFLQELAEEGFAGFTGTKNPASKERGRIYDSLLKFIHRHKMSVDVKTGASVCRFLTESCGILLPKNGGNNGNFETEIRRKLNA